MICSVHKSLLAVQAGTFSHKESSQLLKKTSTLQDTLEEVVK